MDVFKLSWTERQNLAAAYRNLTTLGDVWRDTAEQTREKQNNSEFGRGMAAGINLVVKQLQRDLADLEVVLPKCRHDKPITTQCFDCATEDGP
jgi:hypothetical protein